MIVLKVSHKIKFEYEFINKDSHYLIIQFCKVEFESTQILI
jgi:hypothetical protein